MVADAPPGLRSSGSYCTGASKEIVGALAIYPAGSEREPSRRASCPRNYRVRRLKRPSRCGGLRLTRAGQETRRRPPAARPSWPARCRTRAGPSSSGGHRYPGPATPRPLRAVPSHRVEVLRSRAAAGASLLPNLRRIGSVEGWRPCKPIAGVISETEEAPCALAAASNGEAVVYTRARSGVSGSAWALTTRRKSGRAVKRLGVVRSAEIGLPGNVESICPERWGPVFKRVLKRGPACRRPAGKSESDSQGTGKARGPPEGPCKRWTGETRKSHLQHDARSHSHEKVVHPSRSGTSQPRRGVPMCPSWPAIRATWPPPPLLVASPFRACGPLRSKRSGGAMEALVVESAVVGERVGSACLIINDAQLHSPSQLGAATPDFYSRRIRPIPHAIVWSEPRYLRDRCHSARSASLRNSTWRTTVCGRTPQGLRPRRSRATHGVYHCDTPTCRRAASLPRVRGRASRDR